MRIAYYSAAIANDLKVAASDMKLRKELQTARRALERLNKERALTVARYRVDLDADMRRVLEGLNDLVVRAGTMGGKKVPRSAREWDAFITAATENLGTGGMGRGDVAELLHGAPRAQRARGSALKKKTTKAGVRRTRKERVRKSDQRRFVKKGTKVAPDG
jgi:hypothetical protein